MTPKFRRGSVLVDSYRLYVVLDSKLVKRYRSNLLMDEVQYKCLIIALLDGFDPAWDEASYPGQIRNFGSGVEMDEHVGETELPATL